MAEQRERPLYELLSRDMVDIYVGADNQHWVLHEKLLCHRSKFFSDIFYAKTGHRNTAMGLPDEDEEPFKLFVGWLYSETLPHVAEEQDLANLFELYLMGEKWAIKSLMVSVLDTVRRFYRETDTYPGLRRVQYIYANTPNDSPMRELLVKSVARGLVLQDGLPAHWDKALRKNGQLAVDIILAIQKWGLDAETLPDPRDDDQEANVDRAIDQGVVKHEEVTPEALAKGINGVKINGDLAEHLGEKQEDGEEEHEEVNGEEQEDEEVNGEEGEEENEEEEQEEENEQEEQE